MSTSLKSLFQILGYHFKDASLLELALTHRSYSDPNNERLEFLGDAILNDLITQKLFHEYPHHQEGDLSRFRANLVNRDILAVLAKKLEISQYLHLGAGELKSGGLERSSILADAMEAVIGAIYLDGGMQACQDRITAWYSNVFIDSSSRGLKKDPKTQLQEYLQAHKMNLPVYTLISVEGNEHMKIFHMACHIDALKQTSTGQGSSRRRAEQDAAQHLLMALAS